MVEERCDHVAVQAMQFGVFFRAGEDFEICSIRLEGVDGSMKMLEMIE
jgi:hypothetical protein